MKRKVLAVVGVVGLSLMTGCGQKEVSKNVENVVESTVDSSIQESSVSESTDESTDTTPDESNTVVDLENDMDFSIFKAPESESDDGSEYVIMYGMLGDHLDNDWYEVYTANGTFVFSINEHTVIEEGVELTNGTFVEVINTGVVTMSLPGQIADVLEVKVVDESDVLVEGRSIEEFRINSDNTLSENMDNVTVDYSIYPDVIYDNEKNEVTFFGEVAKVDVLDNVKDYYVYTANGDKIFHINNDMDIDASIGSYVMVVTDGIETRTLPGELSGIKSVEFMSDDMINEIKHDTEEIGTETNEEVKASE